MLFKCKLSHKFILILSIVLVVGGFVLPNLSGFGSVCLGESSSAPAGAPAGAMEDKTTDEAGNVNIAQMPQDFGEAGAFAMELLGGLPGAMKESLQEAKEIWRKTWVKWWVEKIAPWLKNQWQKIKIILDKQIERIRAILSGKYYDTMEQQGSVFRQELEKEKQELFQEISKYTGPIREKFKQMFSLGSLWEKIKGLIK